MPVCQLLLFEIPQRMPIEFYGESHITKKKDRINHIFYTQEIPLC